MLRVVAPWTFDKSDPLDTGYIFTRLDAASVALDPFEVSYRLPRMRWAA